MEKNSLNTNNYSFSRKMQTWIIFFTLGIFVHDVKTDNEYFYKNILIPNEEVVSKAKQDAIDWLEGQRSRDWGWGKDTPRMITSLQLARSSWFHRDDLKSQLSVKQMEIDLLVELSGVSKIKRISPGRLAQYVNALNSICLNPSSFHHHDLISIINSHKGDLHPYSLAYVILTHCNDGKHPRKKQVWKLLDKINPKMGPDTTAMVAMALQCLSKQHYFLNLTTTTAILLNKLKLLQKEDGSFGNIYTSALVVQALLPESDEDGRWNATKALNFILSQQRDDGSFKDKWATSDVLPILNGKSYANIITGECHEEVDIPESNGDHVDPLSNKINMNYSLWIDGDKPQRLTISLTISGNSSFYEIMKLAAEHDDRFRFKSTETSLGPYVHTINNIPGNSSTNYYWLLAKMDDPHQSNNVTISTVGVKHLYPQDGDHIVFWYKNFSSH